MGEVKERPILFSGPMVLAILDGRKTQTRRLVRDPPAWWSETACLDGTTRLTGYTRVESDAGLFIWSVDPARPKAARLSPYGAPGDRLWVRETWRGGSDSMSSGLHYRADADEQDAPGQWRPSIHMPRWASRLTLEVTAVRAERLQKITEADAQAEGVRTFFEAYPCFDRSQRISTGERAAAAPHRASFAVLWDEINAGWALWSSNPWVWVVSFTRIDP